ncbi:hypothetical protein ADJ73_07835 [Arsenicicoccus sp. oral taxon 190]|nr:hypothetical protein ADJ73_07835 [Arsenicicoccus sp. oral taxon 190]
MVAPALLTGVLLLVGVTDRWVPAAAQGYLLVTVLVAVVGGLGPALVCAVLSSLLQNWWFVPPLHRLSVQDPAHAAVLVIGLVVAVVVATVVHLAAARARAARAAERLARDDRDRRALLAAVSHDLRTPLAGIKAAVGELRAQDVTHSAATRALLLQEADASADRLDDLISNLLDVSRLEAGALTAQLEETDVDDVLHAVVEGSLNAARVSLVPGHRTAWADPGLLERVLANLVANALRHTSWGVAVESAATGEAVEIRVVDHGEGVADERLFAAFHQVGDRSGGGLGLGLTVARGLTEAMDGTLDVRATPGGGLTMVVTLPAGPAARETTRAGTRAQAVDGAGG